jgi:hypothetical protein
VVSILDASRAWLANTDRAGRPLMIRWDEPNRFAPAGKEMARRCAHR